MNSHIAYAVLLVLCCKFPLVNAGEQTSAISHETLTAPTGAAQNDAQRRRADLRAALRAQQSAGETNQNARQLSAKDRAELRQQLRDQRQKGQHP